MELDAVAWNARVAQSAWPDFLQTWEWGELKRLTGWRAHRVAAWRDGRAIAVCSVLERRLPGLGPLLYAPRGPLVDWSSGEAVAAIMERLQALGRERGAVVLKCDPGVPRAASDCADALARHGFRALPSGPDFDAVQPRFVMRLPIQGRDPDEILAAMAPKTRYNIRLSQRRGVATRVGVREDLPAFYALLHETARRDGFLVRTLPYFERLWETCVEPGLARLWLAELDGELLAGAIAFLLGNTAWYLYGASASRRRDAMASYGVQWAMIRWALESGCHVYDFRGVSGRVDPSHHLYGLYRFKLGFGGRLVEYAGEWDRPLRPAAYLLAQRGLPLARRVLAAMRRRKGSEGAAAAETDA